MKQIMKVVILFILIGLSITSCSNQKNELYDENPSDLLPEVAEYYDSLYITANLRKNAEAVYWTSETQNALQFRFPEYWEKLFLIECYSTDNVDTIIMYDKYNYDYYYAHDPYAQQFQQKYGKLWAISVYSYDYYNETHLQKYPDSCNERIGANSIIIGSDEKNIYLLSLPTGIEFFEEDNLATNIYKTSMGMKDKIIEDFLEINRINKNESAPHIN